jgi:hypothetical protein
MFSVSECRDLGHAQIHPGACPNAPASMTHSNPNIFGHLTNSPCTDLHKIVHMELHGGAGQLLTHKLVHCFVRFTCL